MPFNLPDPSIYPSDHVCDSGYIRLVTCFHTEGMCYGNIIMLIVSYSIIVLYIKDHKGLRFLVPKYHP